MNKFVLGGIMVAVLAVAVPVYANHPTAPGPRAIGGSSVNLQINGQHPQDGSTKVVVVKGEPITVTWQAVGVGTCNTGNNVSGFGWYRPLAHSGSETINNPPANFGASIQCTLAGGTNMAIQDWLGTRLSQCSDDKDNDGDGKVDMNDPGCDSPEDDDERNKKHHHKPHSDTPSYGGWSWPTWNVNIWAPVYHTPAPAPKPAPKHDSWGGWEGLGDSGLGSGWGSWGW